MVAYFLGFVSHLSSFSWEAQAFCHSEREEESGGILDSLRPIPGTVTSATFYWPKQFTKLSQIQGEGIDSTSWWEKQLYKSHFAKARIQREVGDRGKLVINLPYWLPHLLFGHCSLHLKYGNSEYLCLILNIYKKESTISQFRRTFDAAFKKISFITIRKLLSITNLPQFFVMDSW